MSREAFEAWFADYLGPLTTKAEKHSMWVQWQAARAAALEEAAEACERISDEYQEREGLKFAELKTDAQEGASECAGAIRALKEKE